MVSGYDKHPTPDDGTGIRWSGKFALLVFFGAGLVGGLGWLSA